MSFWIERVIPAIATALTISPLTAYASPTASLPAKLTLSPTVIAASETSSRSNVLKTSQATDSSTRRENRTVSDYFLQAPGRYFKLLRHQDDVSPETRQRLMQDSQAVVDISNGYIQTSSLWPDLCGSYTMAIFRRSQGAHLVAFNTSCTVGDKLIILDPDLNWQDVTAEVFPLKLQPNTEQTVHLPRQGRMIKIREQRSQRLLAKFQFTEDQFHLVR